VIVFNFSKAPNTASSHCVLIVKPFGRARCVCMKYYGKAVRPCGIWDFQFATNISLIFSSSFCLFVNVYIYVIFMYLYISCLCWASIIVQCKIKLNCSQILPTTCIPRWGYTYNSRPFWGCMARYYWIPGTISILHNLNLVKNLNLKLGGKKDLFDLPFPKICCSHCVSKFGWISNRT
jgi:hypothetical protein